MHILIRKLENTENEYFAYTKSLCGKATYFLHFKGDVWGSVLLYHFAEMLKSYFEVDKIELKIFDKTISLKNKFILKCLNKGCGIRVPIQMVIYYY